MIVYYLTPRAHRCAHSDVHYYKHGGFFKNGAMYNAIRVCEDGRVNLGGGRRNGFAHFPKKYKIKKRARFFTAFDNSVTPWRLVWDGLGLDHLAKAGIKLPNFLTVNGQIRRVRDWRVVMEGPQ